jgi:2-oxoglutarate ferredoxin oxidoreductase subunit alpha
MTALGMAAAGLDFYYSYPMTPSSPILHYLAGHGPDLGVTVIHPENEIAVINMALGSVFAGGRTAVGSSGGGFALMEEAFSLAGMIEAPLLCVLASRPGPSTGLPTYTAQGDLNFALNQGHGEFPRLVAAPGSIEEAFSLAAQMLDLVWRFQTPGILLTDKHLGESATTVEPVWSGIPAPEPLPRPAGDYQRYRETPTGVSPLSFSPAPDFIRWNSYEHDEFGLTTEAPAQIVKMYDKRIRKGRTISEYLKGIHTVNVIPGPDPVIIAYGSAAMTVREALIAGGFNATVVQPIFLEPLPVWELDAFRGRQVIVVEQSATGQFASRLREKAGIEARAVIAKYDGRPFDPEELARQIMEAARG